MEKRFFVMAMDLEYARASCSCALSFKARTRDCKRSSTFLERVNKGSNLKVGNYLASVQRRRASSNKVHERINSSGRFWCSSLVQKALHVFIFAFTPRQMLEAQIEDIGMTLLLDYSRMHLHGVEDFR